jgi:hypothetical protein
VAVLYNFSREVGIKDTLSCAGRAGKAFIIISKHLVGQALSYGVEVPTY